MDTSANEYENIYEGLGSESFNLDQEIEKLKIDNHMLERHVTSLEEDIEKLTKVVVNLKTTQMNLSNNISSLYRTAHAEIERKDRMIADLRHELDNVLFKRTDIKPTIKDSNLTASKKPKCDESRPYEWSGNKSERMYNYEDRDRCSKNIRRNGNGGRYEERQSRSARDSYYKKKTRESFDEYEEKHKLSRRKQSNESIGRSDECRKTKQGHLENDLLRKQILNMERKNFIDHKIPKKKLKFVESLEKEIKRKSLTPQNSFEEVYPKKEDLKKSKCNRPNVVFERKNEEKSTTIEISKHCIDKLITRESTNPMKITKDITSEKPRTVKLESNKSENKIENRLKQTEIEFKDKSSIYPEKSQSNLKKSSKFLRTDCFQNRNSIESGKKNAVAVIPKIEKKTEASNLQLRQLGSFEFNMTSLESVSCAKSNTSTVDEESRIEDGEIVETSFVENLNMEDTKMYNRHADISKNHCKNISTKNDRISGFKNPEYKTGEFKSVESIKNILSATHLKKEWELSCVLKTNNSTNVDNIEITSKRNNISLLDTVEDKVTKYSDMKSILQQTLLNNCESAGNVKKILDDNSDYVLDDKNNKPVIGEKFTVLSNIVLTTNSNIVKENINYKEIDNVSSNISEIVNVDSENQSEILGSLKDATEEIKELIEIDNNDTKGNMENSTEISKDVKIRRSTRIKRDVSGSKNNQENSPEQKNKQIDEIEHETTAEILNGPFDNLSDNCNQKSLAPLKTSGCKSNSVENIKDKNPNTRIYIDKKKLSDQLVSSINKPNLVVKIEDTNISNIQIPSDRNHKHSSLQDYNKSSIGKLENVRNDSKSLEYLESGNTGKLDLVIKSSRKLDVASCKSKLPELELDNSNIEGERLSDSYVLEGYQKSLLEEMESPSKELILEKIENDGCAKAKMSSTKKECNLSEDERSSVGKLKIASFPSIPQKQIDGKGSSGRHSNKKSTGKLEIISRKSTSLEKTEQNNILKEKGSSVNGKENSPGYKHSSTKLENVTRKSKSLHKMESEQSTNSEKVSDRDKHTSPDNCKNSSSVKIVSKSQLLEKNEDKNVANKTKVSFEMDQHNCKTSEKNENTSSIKEKKQSSVITSSARKSETTWKKSKSFNKVDDENNTKKKESGYDLKIPLDICKKSSEKLETAASKSQLTIGKNSDKNEVEVFSSINNPIPEDNKKAFPGNLEVTSSKLKYPSEILDYGNVTKRKKGSSGNSEDNLDNKAQSSDKFAKNICSKRRKGQHDRVEKLPKLGSKNVGTEYHELPTKSMENISSIDKLCVDESVHDTEKTCDIKSEIDNDTKSVKGENIANDVILSDKITYQQEVLDEYETAEKGASKIHSGKSDSATPTKSLIRRRITPTPVKDTKQVCSFANILEKNQPTTFPESSPLHLTHEGEIPILHIEENNFSTVRVEEAFKLGDSNIMKLLDTMHLSNMDSELSKFKSNTDNLDTIEPINQLENRLSFENIMDKITPIVCKSDLKKCEVIDSGKITKNTCGAVGNLSTGNRKRRRICRVIVLE